MRTPSGAVIYRLRARVHQARGRMRDDLIQVAARMVTFTWVVRLL
jgi:hypothetical protein